MQGQDYHKLTNLEGRNAVARNYFVDTSTGEFNGKELQAGSNMSI